MLFNSLHYLVFFPVVIALYFNTPQRFRWFLLLAASYYFYMAWKPGYVLLLIASTLTDFVASHQVAQAGSQTRRRQWLILSLTVNFGLLFFFKYYNFFTESLHWISGSFPLPFPLPPNIDVLLPIGISFYTFQTVSYTVEVYRGHQKPEKHLGYFALYVSFFPQLVAGPIERPSNLLPQFKEVHTFDYHLATSGLKLMAWGMFKKVVIADRLALVVDPVYGDPSSFPGPMLLIATICFGIQIYCDFSGYSDIAIGTARIMGIKLMRNFDQPYLANSVADFWRRWHISLSTWFRDYVYISLGGNRVAQPRWYMNIMIVFLLAGLWHGANWTFFIWGALHGSCLVCHHLTQPMRHNIAIFLRLAQFPQLYHIVQIIVTFSLVNFLWIFFRADTISDAYYIVTHLPTGWPEAFAFQELANVASTVFGHSDFSFIAITLTLWVVLIVVMFAVEYHEHPHHLFQNWPSSARWPAYWLVILAIFALGSFGSSPFIYFQF